MERGGTRALGARGGFPEGGFLAVFSDINDTPPVALPRGKLYRLYLWTCYKVFTENEN